MYISKKNILTYVCLCAALAIYNNSDDAFGSSISRILYTEEHEK